jgi:hypothetical protein
VRGEKEGSEGALLLWLSLPGQAGRPAGRRASPPAGQAARGGHGETLRLSPSPSARARRVRLLCLTRRSHWLRAGELNQVSQGQGPCGTWICGISWREEKGGA